MVWIHFKNEQRIPQKIWKMKLKILLWVGLKQNCHQKHLKVRADPICCPFMTCGTCVSHCTFLCFMTNRTNITHFCSVLPSTRSLRYCLKPSQTCSRQTAVFYWKLLDAVPVFDHYCEDFCIFFDFYLIYKQDKDNNRIYCYVSWTFSVKSIS
jgi:hypothetical protein